MAGALTIGFTDVLDVVTAVFDVPADGRKALTSRLKHLQGKSFPPGVNVGRGGRVRYDADAVMGVVLVMALASAFIPPNQAVEVVRTHWDDWRDLLRSAAEASLITARQNGPSVEMVAIIESNALADLGGATPSEGRSAGLRGTLAFRTASRSEAAGRDGAVRGAATLVDVPALLARSVPAIAAAADCGQKDVFEALRRP